MASLRQPVSKAFRRSQSTLYICQTCRTHLQRSLPAVQQRQFASKQDLPLTERVRRKIWGTDNPPGLADPYGGPSFLEKRRMRREAAERKAAGVQEDNIRSLNSAAAVDNPDHEAPTEYVEARTWDGLQHVGHLGDWRDLAPQSEDQYTSWLDCTSQPATDRRELLSCLHQAIVECLACKEAQIPPETTSMFDPSEVDPEVYAGASIELSAEGFRVQFGSPEGKQILVTFLQAVEQGLAEPSADADQVDQVIPDTEEILDQEPANQEELAAEGAEIPESDADHFGAPMLYIGVTHYDVHDQSFLATNLNMKDSLSFTILKRFSQLSGHRIPDPILNTIIVGKKPLSHLIDTLHEAIQPKPKNLAEILMQKQQLAGQSNVWILPRRETPVDRQKEVGRWKVIEKELQDRGLPVLGKLRL